MDLVESNSNKKDYSIRHPWEIARQKVFLDLIKPHIDIEKKVSILDVGCGDSYFIGELSVLFPHSQFTGIDIHFTDNDIGNFRKIYPNVNLYKSIEDFRTSGHKIDLVLLMDVIEHIEFDQDFLKNDIYPLLKENKAKLLITVPAFQCLFSTHDVFLLHYRRYSQNLLQTRLLESKLKPIHSGYFFLSLLLARMLIVMKEKLVRTKNEDGVSNWEQGSFITNIIVTILYLDYSIFSKIKIPGLSVFAIAECKD